MVAQLRAAGCVFAEDEATILRDAATDDRALDEQELAVLCARRVAGEPLEHLVGWVDFAGHRLRVGSGVFVPRKRSELLAAVAVAALAPDRGAVFVEAYCGAAPIAATVRRWVPDAQVHATDIDLTALRFAYLNLGGSGSAYPGDGLDGLPASLRGSVDVIAAVPPYVPDDAVDLLPHEAADHEPRRALLAGADGLDHFRRLVRDAPQWLVAGGLLAIEVNRVQVPPVVAAASHFDPQIVAHRDSQTVVLTLTRRSQ